MVIFIEISKPHEIHTELDELAEFILKALEVEVHEVEEYKGYPSDDRGEIIYQSNQVSKLRELKSDYRILECSIKNLPFIMVLTYNKTKPEFEYPELYFSPITNQTINWNNLFKGNFVNFCKSFQTMISKTKNIMRAYIGTNQENKINLGHTWFFYYKYENEFIIDTLDLLLNWVKDEYDVKNWLKINSKHVDQLAHIIEVVKKDTFAGIYSTNEPIAHKSKIKSKLLRSKPKNTVLKNMLDKLQSLNIAYTTSGSISLYGDDPNPNMIRVAINDIANMLLYGINKGVDIQKLTRDIIDKSNEFIDKLEE